MTDRDRTMEKEAEEIRDILIAISVIAKRLATKLEDSQMEEERNEKHRKPIRDTWKLDGSRK
ncbi:MAG: hypothetical protein K6F35_07830 [Lachnospiraceae bacterium]|nr:hypothetical protein [Lachnospiraceae bacterium]